MNKTEGSRKGDRRSQILKNVKGFGLTAGIICFLITVLLGPPEGMNLGAWRVAGVGMLMAFWWMTEAVPIPVTSLIPLAVFPVMQIADIKTAAAPYAHPLIYLFLGGFLIAEAVQRAGLHKRIALFILSGTAIHRRQWSEDLCSPLHF